MDHDELGVAMAVGHLAELRHHADHCRTCARQAGLLDHDDRVQHQEARLWQAHRLAHRALWSSATAIPLAAIALLSG
jgi:hypothetical protein